MEDLAAVQAALICLIFEDANPNSVCRFSVRNSICYLLSESSALHAMREFHFWGRLSFGSQPPSLRSTLLSFDEQNRQSGVEASAGFCDIHRLKPRVQKASHYRSCPSKFIRVGGNQPVAERPR